MNGNRSHRGANPVPKGQHLLPETTPEYPTPMNALDRLRQQSLAVTGGRTPNMFPQTGRSSDFAREEEIRTKTSQKRPIAVIPRRTPANDPAGPPLDTNLTQISSDDQGKIDTSEWMHSWFGHACGCGEEPAEEVRRINGRQV